MLLFLLRPQAFTFNCAPPYTLGLLYGTHPAEIAMPKFKKSRDFPFGGMKEEATRRLFSKTFCCRRKKKKQRHDPFAWSSRFFFVRLVRPQPRSILNGCSLIFTKKKKTLYTRCSHFGGILYLNHIWGDKHNLEWEKHYSFRIAGDVKQLWRNTNRRVREADFRFHCRSVAVYIHGTVDMTFLVFLPGNYFWEMLQIRNYQAVT